jgi:enoyl-CoA hydratase/carnithine racemase
MSISPSEKVLVSIEDGIATLRIDNPAANTWDLESLPALEAVVNKLNDMAEVRALVITGQGAKFFSAGA